VADDPLDAVLEAEGFDAWANPDDDVGDYLDEVDREYGVPLIGDLRAGETVEDRNRRILDANKLQRENARPGELTLESTKAAGDGRATLLPRRAGAAVPRGTILHQRTRLAATTFATDDELRLFLAERTDRDFAELIRPTPRGGLNAEERERRAELARLVAEARAAGAGYEPLKRVLGRSLATVHQLARDGQSAAAA
jgi:hypothetical protein